MKKLLVLLAVGLTITSAYAQRRNRPVFTRPAPVYPSQCSYDLQRKGLFDSQWLFVERITEYDCFEAQYECEHRKSLLSSYPNEYRCVFTTTPAPVPNPPPRPRSCEYRIETRFGYEPERFTATGFNACEQAEIQCDRVLRIKRSRGQVGREATCVNTATRPTPRPPRSVTAHCTVEQYFNSNSGSRPTGNRFNATGRGRTYDAARNAACSQAFNQCSQVSSGRFYCVELN